MLALSRTQGERITMEDVNSGLRIELEVVKIRGDEVQLGIVAPSNVVIWRSELKPYRRRLQAIGQAGGE